MAFVYRYRLPKNKAVVYVGKTSGDDISSLAGRISAHANEEKFKKNMPRGGYLIEYIDGLSAADADILETALVNSCAICPPLNKSKTNWGPPTYVKLQTLKWTKWDRPVRTLDAALPSKPSLSGLFELLPVAEYAVREGITVQAAYKQIRTHKVKAAVVGTKPKQKEFVILPYVDNPMFDSPTITEKSFSSADRIACSIYQALEAQLKAKDEQIDSLLNQIDNLLKAKDEQIDSLLNQIDNLLNTITTLQQEVAP